VTLLAAGRPAAAQVTIPSEFDTSLESIAVAFRSPNGMTLGYTSQPKARGMYPGAVLVHDVGGLTPNVRGVARNLATSGYIVVAPDFLSPQGGTASFRGAQADVQRAVSEMGAPAFASQVNGAAGYLKSHGAAGRGVSLVGYGWGGTQALAFAAGRTDVAACVAFYPDPQQSLKFLARLTAPSLAIFAADDPATSAGVQQFEQAAKSSRRPHTVKVFPGTMRGFHDPGETKLYKADVAKEAWTLVVQHLDARAKDAKTPASGQAGWTA
jgi:carboxymethylenebutenolidase